MMTLGEVAGATGTVSLSDYDCWGCWKCWKSNWDPSSGWGYNWSSGYQPQWASTLARPSTCDLFDYESLNTPASKQTSSPAASAAADKTNENQEKAKDEGKICDEQKKQQDAAAAEQEQQRLLQKAHHAKYMRFYRSLEGPSLTIPEFMTLGFHHPPRSEDPR